MSCTELTSLLDLESDEGPEIFQNVSVDNMLDILQDMSYPLELRIKALKLYTEQYPRELMGLLKRMIGLYSMTQSSLLKSFLISACEVEEFPYFVRLNIADDLCCNLEN